ncbi:MAG: TolC family protein [Pontiellaceae bacterium]|nr:TolC family protein [Pontiellaceae bacterium]
MNRYTLIPLVLLLGGCVHFIAQPIDPQSTLTAFNARSLNDPQLAALMRANAPAADQSEGWSAADLTLAAFYFQPELAVYRAQWETALAGIDWAGERPNPTLSVAPVFNSSTASGAGISPWILGLGLNVPLDYSGKRKAAIAEAEALAQAAWFQLLQAGWDTRSLVRSEMLAVYAARQQAELRQERESLLEERLKQIEGRNNLGAAAPMEVRQARQDWLAAGVDLLESQKQEDRALARLAAAVGIPLSAIQQAPLDFSEFDSLQLSYSDVLSQALTQRADILEKLAEYEAAQARLQLEISRQYPDLSIGPGYEFDQEDHKWGLDVSLTLPILNQNQGAIEAARRERDAAAARFNALQARVAAQSNESFADYTGALKQFRAAQELERESEQTYQLLQQQAELGAVALSRLIDERLAVNEAAQLVAEARIEALSALGRLKSELQNASDSPDTPEILNPSFNDNGDSDENN